MEPVKLNAQLDLPGWKSHKTVLAAQILSLYRTGMNYEVGPGGDSGWRFVLVDGLGEVVVSNALADRDAPRMPKEGDYYIRYSDGYESWSPKEVFEAGYSRI